MPKIRIADFETSGFEPPEAEVCEYGFCDLTQNGEKWEPGQWFSTLHEVKHMPPETRAVHHLGIDDLKGHPKFLAPHMWLDAVNADVSAVAAHSVDFEQRFWGTPMLPVICTYKSALRVWPEAPSHSNGALRYWLQEQGLINPVHELTIPAHRAGPDAYVTAHILSALLQRVTGSQMVKWTKEPRLLPTCPIGKFRGKKWPDVEAGFLTWMTNQADMDPDFVWNARRELERRRNPEPSEAI